MRNARPAPEYPGPGARRTKSADSARVVAANPFAASALLVTTLSARGENAAYALNSLPNRRRPRQVVCNLFNAIGLRFAIVVRKPHSAEIHPCCRGRTQRRHAVPYRG